MDTINKKLVLRGALVAAALAGNAILREHSIDKEQPYAPIVRTVSLEAMLKDIATNKSGIDARDYSLKTENYKEGDLPFDLSFAKQHTTLTSKDGKSIFLFSNYRRLSNEENYLGHAKEIDENKRIWLSEFVIDKDRKYTKKFQLVDGKFEEYLDEKRENKNIIYKINGNSFVKDKKYRGRTYGWDGEHYLNDRGPGMYFKVTGIISKRNEDGKFVPIEDVGEFFNQSAKKMSTLCDECYVPVRRRIGTNKFSLDSNERYQAKTFAKIVPFYLRAK